MPHDSDAELFIYNLEWRFYKSLLDSATENIAYSACALALSTFFRVREKRALKYICITLCSFYGASFLVLLIIWKLNDRLQLVVAVYIFLAISHFQTQKSKCRKQCISNFKHFQPNFFQYCAHEHRRCSTFSLCASHFLLNNFLLTLCTC